MPGIRSILCALSLVTLVPFAGRAVERASAAASPATVDATACRVNPLLDRTNANTGFDDKINRNDPDFVKVSLLVVEPGGALYSCYGHACLRLVCPKFNLDYCFSYEAEAAASQILKFFSGKLKMGMFAVPTEEFLSIYRQEGRGVEQYALYLPPEAKQRLWKLMDDKVAEGANLSYDYIKRSCAYTLLTFVMEALGPLRQDLKLAPWPTKYKQSRREILAAAIEDYPWTRLVIHIIVGAEGDETNSTLEKVVVPSDLLAFFQGARLYGKPLAAAKGENLVASKGASSKPFVTPIALSLIVVALAAINLFLNVAVVDWLFLSAMSALGLFLTFMVCFSSLPATGWNWLLVPFNPLPLVCWKWREKWAAPFVGVLCAWIAFILLWPHMKTDWSCVILAVAYAVFFAKFIRGNILRERLSSIFEGRGK